MPRGARSPSFGDLLAFRRKPLEFLTDLSRRGDEIVPIRLGWRTAYLLNDPELIRQLLQTNAAKYRKNFGALRPLCGLSVLLTQGDTWRGLRRTAQPAFHPESMEQLSPDLECAAANLVSRWRGLAASGRAIDVCLDMFGVSLDALFRAFLGEPRQVDPYEIAVDMHTATQAAGRRAFRLTDLAERLPMPRQLAVRAAERRLHTLPERLLADNRKSGNTLLSLLVAARDDPRYEAFDDRQLHNEIMTYLATGSDTMAAALSWSLYVLAGRPALVEDLRHEISRVFKEAGSVTEALPRLTLTARVFEETLRLYPPVWALSRKALEADQLGDLTVAPNTILIVGTYALHRDPRFWEDPETFDPDRFLPGRKRSREAYTFLPFGAAARTCIGKHLALLQGVLVIAKLVQHFRFSLPRDFRVEPETGITMKPRRLPIFIQPRD